MKYPIAFLLLMSATGAWAHPGHGGAGFGAGLLHPLLGLDHWLGMLGLGLWSRAAGVARPALATVGAGLALGAFAPFALPLVEPMLAASVLAAGLMGLGVARLPARLGLVLACAFSLVHGNAHGQEMAGAAAAAGAICMSGGLMGLGWLAGSHAGLGKAGPALVALLGAGLLAVG